MSRDASRVMHADEDEPAREDERMDRLHAAPLTAGDRALEPLRVGHAREMTAVLADPDLYAFTGGTPPTTDDLERRYTAQAIGHSTDHRQTWLNWIVRDAAGGAVGYVQATVEDDTAELAWVVGSVHQGRGHARAAAGAVADWVIGHGVRRLVAHVHPDHLASTAVARGVGLAATGRLVDGEVEWARPATTPAVAVRSAVVADLDRVLPLWRIAAEDTDRPPDTDTALRRLLARDPGALLLATVGDVLLGTVIAGWDGWRGHLYRLAVHPSWRRQGIARQLVRAAEDRLRHAGAGRADAMVLDANADAHALWAGLGFRRQATWSRWVEPL